MTSLYEELSNSIKKNEVFIETYNIFIKDVVSNSLGFKTGMDIDKQAISKLIETAAILSLSNDSDKEMALTILNGLLICNVDKSYLSAIKTILMRLGNFPTAGLIELLNIENEDALLLDLGLRNEIVNKFRKNKIDENTVLTDFQADLYGSLYSHSSVSLSAPTSAGKTFIITKFITNLLKEERNLCICIIVPTKALISQYRIDFAKQLQESDVTDVSILTTTTQIEESFSESNKAKYLLILTQERLQYLLFFNKSSAVKIDVLVIDEAQKIADGARGVILESTIIEVASRNRDIQIISSCPLADNPEIISRILNKENTHVIKSFISPVPQFIFDVRIFYNRLRLKLYYEKELIEIDTNTKFDEKIQGVYKNIASISTLLGKDQMNIIFANGPSAAELIANEICGYVKIKQTEELFEFIKFLENEVHPLYSLITYLYYGVGVHYSKMPAVIRQGIEELYKEQHISYLCCTSTLLEGVNLPARNIFVYRPQEGIGNNMSERSFWNLVGRAGRLTKEYVGNIFCIDTRNWEDNLYDKDKRYTITSATEDVFETKLFEFTNYLDEVFDVGEDREIFEQTASFFIRRRLDKLHGTVMQFITERNIKNIELDEIEELDEMISKIADEITLPLELLQRNASIDPRKQQALYNYFKSDRNRISLLVPLHPKTNRKKYYERLSSIFKLIDSHFQGKHDNYHRYIAVLATKWVSENTLREIIDNQIEYNTRSEITKKEDREFVNNIIRDVFEKINDEISYKYARYTQCYTDILGVVLQEYDMATVDLSLPLYLEYGVHEETSLYIISKGCSRSLAIKLTRLYKKLALNQSQEFSTWLKNNQRIILTNLPITLREEFLYLLETDKGREG